MFSTRAMALGGVPADHADAEAVVEQLAVDGGCDLRFVDLGPGRVVELRVVQADSGPR